MRVMITGGTGLIGRRLTAQLLSDGHEVIILTRSPEDSAKLTQGARAVKWDAKTADGWGELVNGDTAIVNLAGKPIMQFPFTNDHKQQVLESRVAAGRAVKMAVEQAAERPRVVIQSGAIGYYGNRGDEMLTEGALPADDWFGNVCSAWEDAVDGAPTRIVKIRTGLVLDKAGGALQPFLLAARVYGGSLGNGRQWMSWIHNEDECRAIRFLIDTEKATGPFNLVAPNPVRNKEFVKTLARVQGTAAIFPAPELALRVALGGLAPLVLDSQRVVAQKLLDLGFEFKFPTLEPALRDLLKK
ncbi:MAG: TIGR01777 family oxidoreductase [Anaerolineae bacterium]|nr:TIGR01777 family oxidoreductase [Anaerolineae bacterium]